MGPIRGTRNEEGVKMSPKGEKKIERMREAETSLDKKMREGLEMEER